MFKDKRSVISDLFFSNSVMDTIIENDTVLKYFDN